MMTLLKFKRSVFLSLLASLLMVLSVFIGYGQDFPSTPNRLVNDYAGALDPAEVQALESKLRAFDDSTSTQIAVVVMRSTGEYDIADYGDRLAQKWGIGDKKYNNGILFLVAIDDRAMTIRTGYGIEGAVPDVIAYRIIENEVKPSFRQGNYYRGIDNGVNALISHTKGEYKSDRRPSDRGEGGGVPIVLIVVAIVVIASLISKGGGKGGGGGKVINSRGASDVFWWTLLNQLGRSGGGSSSGGGFGGGGFGGGSGGFGGFGGGGFGGGGASGRW